MYIYIFFRIGRCLGFKYLLLKLLDYKKNFHILIQIKKIKCHTVDFGPWSKGQKPTIRKAYKSLTTNWSNCTMGKVNAR